MTLSYIILHSNDLHSCFENMPKIADAVEEYRSKVPPERLLLIDCGDHMDRMRIETEGTMGLANVDVLNETGYDLFVPGNNEGLTFAKETISRVLSRHARFDVLGTNIAELPRGGHPEWMHPWRILDKGGVRFGAIGLTARFNQFYHLLGWDIRDPVESVRHATELLRPQVDVLIVVSHLGLRLDQRMAAEIPGIDLILGGHTHHLLENGLTVERTYIGAAGKNGDYLGVIHLEMDMSRRRPAKIEGKALHVALRPDNEKIARLIEQRRAESRKTLSRRVVRLPRALTNAWDRESELGNLLADGLRSWTNAEIGIVNAGQILSGAAEGELTESDLLSLCPSPINPCSVELTGSQILQALEEALIDEFVTMPIRGFGFRGEVLGTLCVSGITVRYDKTCEPYRRVKAVDLDSGEPLNPERVYKVGTIDMFTFGIGYLSLAQGRQTQYYLPEFIRDVLKRQLADSEAMERCRSLRWIAVPPGGSRDSDGEAPAEP